MSLVLQDRPPPTVSLCDSLSRSADAMPKDLRRQLGPRLALGVRSGARHPSPLTLPGDVPAPGAPTASQALLLPHPAGYEETLTRLAAILAKHFADTRIVGTGEELCRGLGMRDWDGASGRLLSAQNAWGPALTPATC